MAHQKKARKKVIIFLKGTVVEIGPQSPLILQDVITLLQGKCEERETRKRSSPYRSQKLVPTGEIQQGKKKNLLKIFGQATLNSLSKFPWDPLWWRFTGMYPYGPER